MSKTKAIIDILGASSTVIENLASNKKVQKVLFGEYSDGKPRSMIDGLNNEIYSPKQKKHNKDKKKHKKDKNKKKYK
jgi:hypothetical protein